MYINIQSILCLIWVKIWKKYYDPENYNNGLSPYPYEIDAFLEWKYRGGDRATNGITLYPSDTYEMIIERVLKIFLDMNVCHWRQDWFRQQIIEEHTWGVGQDSNREKWQKRLYGTQLKPGKNR